jgi:hypothetical protein
MQVTIIRVLVIEMKRQEIEDEDDTMQPAGL